MTKSGRTRTTLAGAISRRRFIQACSVCASAVSALVSGCASLFGPGATAAPPLNCVAPANGDAFDYVIVGSGAGGGPLAANLALAGFTVLLLEAGGDEETYDYQVPAFHARASEDEHLAWNFFVRHYADDVQQKRDKKFQVAQNGRALSALRNAGRMHRPQCDDRDLSAQQRLGSYRRRDRRSIMGCRQYAALFRAA